MREPVGTVPAPGVPQVTTLSVLPRACPLGLSLEASHMFTTEATS